MPSRIFVHQLVFLTNINDEARQNDNENVKKPPPEMIRRLAVFFSSDILMNERWITLKRLD